MVKQKQELVTYRGEESTRTSFTEACRMILQSLREAGRPVNLSDLVRMTDLNRKTVEKCVQFLQVVQKELERDKFVSHAINHRRLLTLEPRVGMLSLPEKTQRLIIRALYYSEPTEELYLISNLYLRKAVNSRHAVSMPKTRVMRKLIKQGQILESTRGVHLSPEGITIAKGTLRIYPELKNTVLA